MDRGNDLSGQRTTIRSRLRSHISGKRQQHVVRLLPQEIAGQVLLREQLLFANGDVIKGRKPLA